VGFTADTGIVPQGGIPALDQQMRPDVYQQGGPAQVDDQAKQAIPTDVPEVVQKVIAGANAIAAGTVNIPGVLWTLNVSDSIFNYLVNRQEVDRRVREVDRVRRLEELVDHRGLRAAAAGVIVVPGVLVLASSGVLFINSGLKDVALDFINSMIDPLNQAAAAQPPYYFGPTVRGVALPAEAAPYMPATPAEIAAVQVMDWAKLAPLRAPTLDAFDRLFAG
jgi:hypothetical protein